MTTPRRPSLVSAARIRTMPEVWVTGVFRVLTRPGIERLDFVAVPRFRLFVLDDPLGPNRFDLRREPR